MTEKKTKILVDLDEYMVLQHDREELRMVKTNLLCLQEAYEGVASKCKTNEEAAYVLGHLQTISDLADLMMDDLKKRKEETA